MHPGYPIEQIYLCREPIDFRKAINGLSVLVEQALGLNPFAGAMYVFVNRSRDKIKVLYWHRNGFCLWQKRLENEKFRLYVNFSGLNNSPSPSRGGLGWGWGKDEGSNKPHDHRK